MRKILLDGNKNFYKANLHCHSVNSDGTNTVEEIKKHYKANGYSVIAFTDHEHLIDNSYLNDDSFLAITACEMAIKEFPEFSTLDKTDMKVCHLNFYAKDAHNVDTPCYNSVYDHFLNDEIKNKIVHSCGEYERVYSGKGISDMIKTANEQGFLVSYNHPRWSLENAEDYLGYNDLWAVEIYNHSCNYMGLYEYDINVYDDFLRKGKYLGCIAGDDNHNINSVCGGFVMINSQGLDYENIITSLENYDFYCSTGPIIKNLYVEDKKAYLTFEKGEYATISTKGRRSKKIDAKNSDTENTVCFDILESDGYVRFDVVDKYGKRANTVAYMVENILN